MSTITTPVCPVAHAARPGVRAPTGCPVSPRVAAFDAFAGPYQVDPGDALAWARAEEPVFYSPQLGYWVVTRYEDIKAVFRDNITFSPRNALEKITPFGEEAMSVLASYDYAMDRTMVNEDEPVHMERRRALMEHFIPENLADKEDLVRRLVRERMDAFIDAGRVDLVDALLWEVPLTVALYFLGVPEDDMATLRRFSVAHTVNTWGRPTPQEQVEVAHSVGKFWQYAGEVLAKMRAEPDGPGWMHYAVRKNAEAPDVVTDSYLHSMMMAIIVAAHETTAHASANMFRRLLADRTAWDAICLDPSLIPNAVEECLRLGGSIVAWRRELTADATVGDVPLPKGAKLLIVMASANKDERHFEDPDTFDLYRDNAVDHLTFGYGSHQCMGKNIARIEMRVFLEEFTRRLPHLSLAEQSFSYLPNISFRGPEHLWVEWDPAANPERADPAVLANARGFAVGAPSRKDIARPVRIVARREEAEGIVGLTLEAADGRPLPRWSPGAHIELALGEYDRKYSLCGDPSSGRYEVAVLREEAGRGGSRHIHAALGEGAELRLRGPHNLFRLDEEAPHSVLIAGGIGITPILAMADRLKAIGAPYSLHYAGRARTHMAFAGRVARDHPDATLHVGAEGGRMDLAAIVADAPEGARIYACGPGRMIAALESLTAHLPDGTLRFEHFAAAPADAADQAPFVAELADSGLTVTVGAEESLLAAVRAVGVDLASDCCEGLCGSCEVSVLEGTVEHRDMVLSRSERAGGGRMMACCSRGRGRIRLAL